MARPGGWRSRRSRPGPCRFREPPPTFTRGRWSVSTRFHDRSLASTAVRAGCPALPVARPGGWRSRRSRPGPCRFCEPPPTFTRKRWSVSTRFHDRSLASTAVRAGCPASPVDSAQRRTFLTASSSSLPLPRTSADLHPKALVGFDPFPRPFAGFDCHSRLLPGVTRWTLPSGGRS
jgi:hypothetical protein